jgi:hypothetical protein
MAISHPARTPKPSPPLLPRRIDDLSPGVIVLRHRLFHVLRVHHRRHGTQQRAFSRVEHIAAKREVYVGSALDDPQTAATATTKAETLAIETSSGSYNTPLSLHVAWHATVYPDLPSDPDPDHELEGTGKAEEEAAQWSPAPDAHSIALETMDGGQPGRRARSLVYSWMRRWRRACDHSFLCTLSTCIISSFSLLQ